MHWWCCWWPGKLERIHHQMDDVQSTVHLKYSYMPVLGLNSKCPLSVVRLLFESAVSSTTLWMCTKLCCLIKHFVQTHSKYVNKCFHRLKNERSIYWIPVLLEVYFQSMTEIKWHALNAVIVIYGWYLFCPLPINQFRDRSLHVHTSQERAYEMLYKHPRSGFRLCKQCCRR